MAVARAGSFGDAETIRKLVHISFGLVALLLRWLSWEQAALLALSALLFNIFVLPFAGGRRIARSERGTDWGIVLYPIAVLSLVLLFRNSLPIAGLVWAIVAFGDGSASLVGRLLPKSPLPWNRDKSVAGLLSFLIFGTAASWMVWTFLGGVTSGCPGWLVALSATTVCAFVESAHTRIDDNITVPLAGAVVAALAVSFQRFDLPSLDSSLLPWLAANVALAVIGYLARSVDVSGMIGGAILGTILILFGGWPLYVALLVFFVVASGLTKAGYRAKAAAGLAQEKGGRRGFSHAFSNVGVAAICAVGMSIRPLDPALLFLCAVASLTTAAADTTGSEVGQWLGRRTFLPLSFRSVPRGTEGAISIEGTLAGALAAIVVACVSIAGLPGPAPGPIIAAVSLAAILGSYLESIVGSWNRRRKEGIPNGVLNFLNTAAGALIAAALLQLV